MEAIIGFGQENYDLCLLPSKANQGPSAKLSKGSLQVRNAKTFTVAKLQGRKALGNINQVQPRKSASTKVAKKDNLITQRCEKYPEIETFIPYNPLDFETFDIPEEHKLSGRCLAGVSLFISREDVTRFPALFSSVISPMENEPINYDSYETSIPSFEDITIDLPPLCDF